MFVLSLESSAEPRGRRSDAPPLLAAVSLLVAG